MSIKEDKWLPDPCYRKVSSPLPSIPPEAKVSSLIDCNSGTWKKEDINQLFLPHEADAIISIPLSLRMPIDWLVWSKTPSGNFSSRSAYRLLASNTLATNPSSSNLNPQILLKRNLDAMYPSQSEAFRMASLQQLSANHG